VPPPVRSKGPQGSDRRRQASPRVLIAAGAAVAVIAVAVMLAVVLTGGNSNALADVPAVGSLAYGLPGSSNVQSMLKGIPQSGTTLGSSKAPVTLTEFIDPQCPYCQEFETQVLPSLVKDDVRAGKLRIQMEPWAFIGPDSVRGQAAVLAAANQNKAFNYAAVLYDNQAEENTGWLTDSMIAAIAKSVPGLQVHTLLNERSSSAVKAAQKQVDDAATARQVTGTPTIFVGKTGTPGSRVNMSSATDKAAVVAAIDRATG
jgi:protein-disulfide isomerase